MNAGYIRLEFVWIKFGWRPLGPRDHAKCRPKREDGFEAGWVEGVGWKGLVEVEAGQAA